MACPENVIDLLNDLLKANNDRIGVYEKVAKQYRNPGTGFKNLFAEMIHQGRQNKAVLGHAILLNGGLIDDEKTHAGKLYTAWMEIRSAVAGKNNTALLESCEFAEVTALRAYTEILNTAAHMVGDEDRKMITDELNVLQHSYDRIRKITAAYRDIHNTGFGRKSFVP